MADEQKSLTDVAKNTGELLQEAGTKTTQTVLAHTEKYHDAYTTIDKIVDSFWERVPYICILCTRQISQNPYPIRVLPS
ncbi:hypothetical protein RQ67_14485, partial [Acinetobacter baumannii]